jgi:ribosomal protein S21
LDHLKRIHSKTLRLACLLKIFSRTLLKELIRERARRDYNFEKPSFELVLHY